MPRYADARGKWFSIVVALAAFAAGCAGDEPVVASDGGSRPNLDAGNDADVLDAAADDAGSDASSPPWSILDSGLIDNLDAELCVLRITAECDGPEDCASAVCCARFDPSEVSLTAIECAQEECDLQRSFPLCHEGQVCPTAVQSACRTSRLIPEDSIGVCAPRTELSQFARPPVGEPVAGLIACGSDECIVGEEQCCIREGFNLKHLQSIPHDSFCAPIGEPCDCEDVDIPPHDGGVPSDEDAGL